MCCRIRMNMLCYCNRFVDVWRQIWFTQHICMKRHTWKLNLIICHCVTSKLQRKNHQPCMASFFWYSCLIFRMPGTFNLREAKGNAAKSINASEPIISIKQSSLHVLRTGFFGKLVIHRKEDKQRTKYYLRYCPKPREQPCFIKHAKMKIHMYVNCLMQLLVVI